MSITDMATDTVWIEKAGGFRAGPYQCALSPDKCMIFDKMLDVDPGDKVLRALPNGKEEHYVVLRADYQDDFHGIPGGFNLALRKDQQIHKTPSKVVNNVTISHSAGFQVGDGNVQNIQNAFLQIEKAISESGAPVEVKSDALSKLKALSEHPLLVAVLGGLASRM